MTKELINLIPKMTSNSNSSGTVECSSEWNGRYGYFAFDENINTMWTNDAGKEAFISYTFDCPIKINSIKLVHGSKGIGSNYIYWNNVYVYGDDTLLTTINKKESTETRNACTFIKDIKNNKQYKKYTFKFDTTSYTYISSIELFYNVTPMFLLEQNNQLYTIKSKFYDNLNSQYKSIMKIDTNNITNEVFEKCGFNDINNILIETTVENEKFKPIDKLKTINDGKFQILLKEL